MGEDVALREVESKLGRLRIAVTTKGLVRLALPRAAGKGFRGWIERHLPNAQSVDWLPALDKVCSELDEYFTGRRLEFTLPLDLRGTPFQRKVWETLLEIPFGEVRTYGEIARRIGKPGAARPVGAAAGANPVPIIVPCHRVVAAGGHLGGYTGGLSTKRKLLAFEKARLPGDSLL
jgi:O-6-methylguanine DNA methyltransferase